MWSLSERAQALVQQLHDLLSSTSWVGSAKREGNVIAFLGEHGDCLADTHILASILDNDFSQNTIFLSLDIHRSLVGFDLEQNIAR